MTFKNQGWLHSPRLHYIARIAFLCLVIFWGLGSIALFSQNEFGGGIFFLIIACLSAIGFIKFRKKGFSNEDISINKVLSFKQPKRSQLLFEQSEGSGQKVETYRYKVLGSEYLPYDVEFTFKNFNLSTTCTCAAGQKGILCKHRLKVLSGDITGVEDISTENLSILLHRFKASSAFKTWQELNEKEAELAMLQRNIINLKKRLAAHIG